MNVKIKMEVIPFPVPDDVALKMTSAPASRADGFKPAPRYPLSSLDYYSLDQLCRNFRSEVFRKAKVRDIDPIDEQQQRNDDNAW